MRLALLSDIHGNSIALDAVFADIEQAGGVDGYLFGGDYCAAGYDPAGVLQRIHALPNAVFIRGNMDRQTIYLNEMWPQVEAAEMDSKLVRIAINVARSMSWTLGAVTVLGYSDWFRDLPLEHRLILPDGTRLLLVHAAPGTDDGRGVRLDHTQEDLTNILAGCEADLVLVGHTHIPLDKQVGDIRVVNLGGVSNPHMPDFRAWYAILEADEKGYRLAQRQVAYDVEAVMAAIRASTHPTPEFLCSYFEGKQISKQFWKDGMVQDWHSFDLKG
ncbi:MAG: metallophosphoesterase family protein [Chloroflexota bacterium]